MAFEVPKYYKTEEWIEGQATDAVYEMVCDYYEIEDIENLTQEQIDEIDTFRNDILNEYSVLQVGFSNLMSHWESNQDYEDI